MEKFLVREPIDKQGYFRDLFLKTKEVLDYLEIPFFMSSSTCLGYEREKDFIDHCNDIDIGIYAKDYTPKIIDLMVERGLKLYQIHGNMENGIHLSFNGPIDRNTRINIYVCKNDNSKTCWLSYNKKYCVSQFELTEVDFLGIKVNIPDPITKYLEECYGKNWRIPK